MPSGGRHLRLVGCAVLLAAAVASGCSDGGGADAAACGSIRREALDPNYLVHVLPGAATSRYLTDPPTSGPHQPAPRLDPVQRRPLPKPVQVGVLEGGNVLLQCRDLKPADVSRLEKLAGTQVVVAPDPDLASSGVTATAWTYKRTCRAVDPTALKEFIAQRAGRGPGTGR
jgi:hypothetical protein